jgi:hypothetical protein
MPQTAEPEIRYWPRIGLYVSRSDAEEYISKVGGHGAVLDEGIEEFVPSKTVAPEALREEVKGLFEHPYEKVPLSEESNVILKIVEFEQNRVAKIKELMKEGMTKDEAKFDYQQKMDKMVREALGLPEETEQEQEHREEAARIRDEMEQGEEE